VFTILLVVLYYSLSLIGIAMGRQDWIPTFLAVWSATYCSPSAASSCFGQMASGSQAFSAFAGWTSRTSALKPAARAKWVGSSIGGRIRQVPGQAAARSIARRLSTHPRSIRCG